ncbi:hypothetical protein V1477_010328 [Vespula maculifrons]|uniref:Uncharacterized protein n=1 Tax=Vespula maculifrons TaxID=7453 RepID=A0ABD2C895_VESMC
MRMGTTVQQNEIVSSQTISSKTRSVEIITAYKEIYILMCIFILQNMINKQQILCYLRNSMCFCVSVTI